MHVRALHASFAGASLSFTPDVAALLLLQVLAVARLGVVVLGTFAALWAPCMQSPADVLLVSDAT